MLHTSKIRPSCPLIAFACSALLFCAPAIHAGQDLRSTEAMVFNCYTCHGTDGTSTGEIKSLHGRSEAYLLDKLLGFKRGEGNPTIMDKIAAGFTDEELARIARYIANLK